MQLVTPCALLCFLSMLHIPAAGRKTVVVDTSSLLQKDTQLTSKLEGATAQTKGDAASSFWTHPLVLGLMLGLLLIGPDHLGTLMALSTLTTGFASFKVGFAWGIGHSLGMIMICPIFFLLKEVGAQNSSISMDQWEYFGDYFIGGSMVFVALYFVAYESVYLEQQADGTYKAKGCACHGSSEHEAPEIDVSSTKFCSKFKTNCAAHNDKKGSSSDVPRLETNFEKEASLESPPSADQENTPLVQKPGVSEAGPLWLPSFLSMRDVQGAVLGMFQGLCCPMGIAGLGFMGRMSVTSSPLMLFMFACVFVMASAVGSGAITLGWGCLTTRGSTSCLSARKMYLASCIATLLLGLCWIGANMFGVLHHINFAEQIHHKIMPMHGQH